MTSPLPNRPGSGGPPLVVSPPGYPTRPGPGGKKARVAAAKTKRDAAKSSVKTAKSKVSSLKAGKKTATGAAKKKTAAELKTARAGLAKRRTALKSAKQNLKATRKTKAGTPTPPRPKETGTRKYDTYYPSGSGAPKSPRKGKLKVATEKPPMPPERKLKVSKPTRGRKTVAKRR